MLVSVASETTATQRDLGRPHQVANGSAAEYGQCAVVKLGRRYSGHVFYQDLPSATFGAQTIDPLLHEMIGQFLLLKHQIILDFFIERDTLTADFLRTIGCDYTCIIAKGSPVSRFSIGLLAVNRQQIAHTLLIQQFVQHLALHKLLHVAEDGRQLVVEPFDAGTLPRGECCHGTGCCRRGGCSKG